MKETDRDKEIYSHSVMERENERERDREGERGGRSVFVCVFLMT